jgi:isoquinoline 1-oxidoreductase beta subunit
MSVLIPSHKKSTKSTSRQFLNVSASTSAVVMTISIPNTLLAKGNHNTNGTNDNIGSVYLRIFPDNTIEISSTVKDMGQHMKTTAPMMLAEELDADWTLVSCVAAKTDLKKKADGVEVDCLKRQAFFS